MLCKCRFSYNELLCEIVFEVAILQRGNCNKYLAIVLHLAKIPRWSNIWNISFNPDKSHTHYLSPKGPSENPPFCFVNNRFEEVQSFKLLDLTISHDLSWANHISKLAFKASHRLDILHHTKSFLHTPGLLSTCKTFIHSLVEYCSPLWTAPLPHILLSCT